MGGDVGDPGGLVDEEVIPFAPAGNELGEACGLVGRWSTLTRSIICCEVVV